MIKDCIDIESELFKSMLLYKPWGLVSILEQFISKIDRNALSSEYIINDLSIIHQSAIIENDAIIKGSVFIGPNCYIGANACLRNGVILTKDVKVGIGCELKSSVIFDGSAVAHFNFIGDSVIGCNVNFEAGSITANHYNERADKTIFVLWNGEVVNTDTTKFGALVGDNSKIGANAVLSPGTILKKYSVVKRLELIEQNQN